QGSIALHTLLTSPDQADAAIAFYRARQAEVVAHSGRTAAQLYAAVERFAATPFWRRRAAPSVGTTSVGAAPQAAPPLRPGQLLRLSEALRIVETPAIVGDLICRVPALVHPALAQPVAFLGQTALAPLLGELVARRTADDILRRWTQRLPLRDCLRVIHWLWEMGIVVPYIGESDDQCSAIDICC